MEKFPSFRSLFERVHAAHAESGEVVQEVVDALSGTDKRKQTKLGQRVYDYMKTVDQGWGVL